MSSPKSVVPLVEESASVSKRPVKTGRVKVATKTETVEELVRADLRTDTVNVSRVPVGREVDRIPEIRTEGDVTIVPVVEEILVVEKRLLLREELHIARSVSTETVEVPVPVRRQKGIVTREHIDHQNEEEDHG